MVRTYEDAIEWIGVEFEPEDFNTFEDYIEAIRDEFQNDNLIDFIESEIQDIFDNR